MSKTYSAGIATAYGAAKQGGYQGSYSDFCAELANLADISAEATTLEAGSSATASYSDGVLSLGIPKGDKGDKGDTGATGATGQTGPTGTDGVSPSVSVTDITGGHRVAITDAQGTENFDVMDGATGNGIASVTKTDTSGLVDTYTITFTNGNTTTFEVTNGRDGHIDNVDPTLTISGFAADAKVTGDAVRAAVVLAELYGWGSVNYTTGYINSNGTVTSNGSFRSSDFIPVSAGDELTYKLYGYSTSVWIITAYDANKDRIANDSLIGESAWKTGTYTVAEGTAYIRISSGSVSSSAFASDDFLGTKVVSTKTYVDEKATELNSLINGVDSELQELDGIASIKSYYTQSPNLLDPTKTTPRPSIGTGYVASDFMPVTAGERYTVWADGSVYRVDWYASDKTTFSSDAIQGKGCEKTAPATAAYAQLVYKSENVTKIMFAHGVVGDYVPFGVLVGKIELPDYIVRDTNNICDPTKYVFASSVRSTSPGDVYGYSSNYATDYIPVEEGATYYASGAGDGYWNKTGAAAYDSDHEFVEGISSFPYTVPNGVEYIRVGYSAPGSTSGSVVYTYPCIRKGETGVNGISKFDKYDTFRLVNSKPTTYEQNNSLYGLKWNAMGDSITEGSGTTKSYRQFISERTGIINRNYGVSNTAIAKRGASSTNDMSIRYVDMDDDADIITVFGGTNDHGNNIPIGQWGDQTVDTVYGAMTVLVEGLINKYMGKRIGFITPLPKYNTGNNTDYSYPSASFMPYIECIKDVCARYSIPVLDLYTESGISPAMASVRTAMIPDGLHPNVVGHELISWQIQRFLERI